ncbi:MAG: zinc metalloprotease HtpX [Chloroflexota bacterium]|nr:zinc metalloprotease HtpX [Dehalococcoidia bacterium]MDW8252352.1 zinc metalloprotease HtpX [Chloroflexota bacterium]
MNNLKTLLLLALLTGLLIFVGRLVGGVSGMVVAFIFAIAMNFGAYWFSDKIALRMAGAHEIDESQDPELFAMVRHLALRANLPMPRVAVIDDPSPNAFATGRDPAHGVVAVTTGIRQLLTPTQLAGVIAHELAHIKNRDTLTMAIVATIAGVISFIGQMASWALMLGGFGRSDEEEGGGVLGGLFAVIVAPIVAMLLQFAISRAREYEADALGARIVGDPEALASALARLEAMVQRVPMEASPATAHLFIVNPFGGLNIAHLFSTHPPTAERIARLRAMQFAYR